MPQSANPKREVVLRSFPSLGEAELVANLLRKQGVDCFIHPDDGGGTIPSLVFVRGVKLYVRERDLERAEELLAAAVPLEDSGPAGEET